MTVAPAPQGPLLMCAEAFRGSDRKYWARWPFHVISVCFPFTQRKRKWAEGTPNPFVGPGKHMASQFRTDTSKGLFVSLPRITWE